VPDDETTEAHTLRMPADLWQFYVDLATEEDRTAAYVIRRVLAEHRDKIEQAKKTPRRRQS
jgi:hypothetical protein